MDHPFPLQALPDAGIDEELDRPVLEHAGADPLLDVLATTVLEDHGGDPRKMKQVAEQEAGRPGADDSDLGSH
jgi:hypothetical protein